MKVKRIADFTDLEDFMGLGNAGFLLSIDHWLLPIYLLMQLSYSAIILLKTSTFFWSETNGEFAM
jgi:hypothetical protein